MDAKLLGYILVLIIIVLLVCPDHKEALVLISIIGATFSIYNNTYKIKANMNDTKSNYHGYLYNRNRKHAPIGEDMTDTRENMLAGGYNGHGGHGGYNGSNEHENMSNRHESMSNRHESMYDGHDEVHGVDNRSDVDGSSYERNGYRGPGDPLDYYGDPLISPLTTDIITDRAMKEADHAARYPGKKFSGDIGVPINPACNRENECSHDTYCEGDMEDCHTSGIELAGQKTNQRFFTGGYDDYRQPPPQLRSDPNWWPHLPHLPQQHHNQPHVRRPYDVHPEPKPISTYLEQHQRNKMRQPKTNRQAKKPSYQMMNQHHTQESKEKMGDVYHNRVSQSDRYVDEHSPRPQPIDVSDPYVRFQYGGNMFNSGAKQQYEKGLNTQSTLPMKHSSDAFADARQYEKTVHTLPMYDPKPGASRSYADEAKNPSFGTAPHWRYKLKTRHDGYYDKRAIDLTRWRQAGFGNKSTDGAIRSRNSEIARKYFEEELQTNSKQSWWGNTDDYGGLHQAG